MLKYPCLVLDHDDTVVQSESTINYPFFCYILSQYRPGETISLAEYTHWCYSQGFTQLCQEKYHFTAQELENEFQAWLGFIRTHIPDPFPGISSIIQRQKEAGGFICVVSHSSSENITRDYQAHFGLLPDAIYGWDMPEAQRKPSPFPLSHIMTRFGLAPSQLLVVDDMKPGLKMARAVGVPFAFAGWGRKDMPLIFDEMERFSDFSFDSPKKLERFLFD